MDAMQIAIPVLREITKRPRILDLMGRFDRWGNMFGPERYEFPYPLFERIRDDGPIVKRTVYGGWIITGYEEARQVLTSEHASMGNSLDILFRVKPYPQLSNDTRALLRQMLLFQDGETHHRLRRLVARTFTPRAVRELEPRTAEIARSMANQLADAGTHDAAYGFTSPFPISVISALIGIPDERWQWAHEKAKIIVQVIDPINSFDPQVVDDATAEVISYLTELAAERKANPTDDLLSGLVAPDDEGDELTHNELISMLTMLFFAGFETTSGVLGNAIVALAANPEQRELVRSNPDLWSGATEELLRYDPAVQIVSRTMLADVEIAGHTIKAGEVATIFLGSANRDPRIGDDLNELHLDRESPQVLSLGHGIHHCLGAAIARLELRVGLRAYIEAMGDYTVDTDNIEWKHSVSLRGPVALPVTPGTRS